MLSELTCYPFKISVCLSALQCYVCSPTREGPWGRSAAPGVPVLERVEVWHSMGVGWGGRILRDHEDRPESSRLSPFWTRDASVRPWAHLPKENTYCCVYSALVFTLERKEHHNGKLQMSAHRHERRPMSLILEPFVLPLHNKPGGRIFTWASTTWST